MDEAAAGLLEKVDIIRERMDVSYKEAKEALERAGGDVVSALVMLEEEKEKQRAGKLVGRLKAVCARSATTRLRLKRGDRTLLEIPASAGVLGLVGMLVSGELAVLGAVGTVTALLNGCSLEVAAEESGDRPGAGDVDTG
ncbi:MAG: hypothetical protein PWP44_545 [Thermacetogenium sp.]|jgi:hypothetical protein|uniref:DUF4342 domain-containing protein n=1 Tax=Thermacetogenium phaeum TaxID=85874 RepID=A0A101FH13_9THEO|nr:MAG: Uncharacterized protein XD66_0432 [Thermacetogenium phaeum]MDN5365342.1 hypothetical protein [Thermacetogenium sp.]MDN5375983.1 hypothetical protein [Thermacetogenium sp.]